MKNVEMFNDEFGVDLDDMLGDVLSKVLNECAITVEGDKNVFTRIGVLIATETTVSGAVKTQFTKMGKQLYIDALARRLGHVCKRVQAEEIKPFIPYKG